MSDDSNNANNANNADKAKTLVRLVAGGFLLVGALNLIAYGLWLKAHHDAAFSVLRCVWLSIPLVIGAVILIKTSALVRFIEDWLEQ
jgi:hypothetical protein